MDQATDSSLIELAKGGDQSAFAELYARYFDPVYDFVARMTRNRDEAADIAQDTFLKAMNALGGLQRGASFKSWIFTIARNTALNRIERSSRLRPLTFEGEDGEEVGFDVVDTDRFSDPEEAAQANAVASLVWQAAAGLDPKQLSLLDLHLRQGLDSGEIADVLGVTKNNGYVMLNRLKKAVEDAIGAFIMFKDGRQYCGDLDVVLGKVDIDGMSPAVRKLVEGHVARCPGCAERKKKLAPLAAFAAFGAIGAPMGAKAHILDGLMQQWPGPAATGGSSGPGDVGGGASGTPGGGGLLERPTFGQKFFRRRAAITAIAGLAAVLMGLLFLPQSPLALIRDNGGDQVQAAVAMPPGGDNDPTTAPAASSTATSTGTPTARATGTVSASPSASATVKGQGSASATAKTTKTNTPVPTPGLGTPTFTPSPTATSTPMTPSPTPTACMPSLGASPDTLTVAPGGTSSFLVTNGSACSTTFSTSSADATWLSSSGGGSVGAADTATVSVSVSASSLPSAPGTYTGHILVAWSGGSFLVTVHTTRTGPPNTRPSINSVTGRCVIGPPASSVFDANVSDDGTVSAVVVTFEDGGGTPTTVTLSHSNGPSWQGNGPSALRGSNFSIRATDNLGLSTTQSFGQPTSCF
jgi:RNA polymerase sigma factor (sigma-70 family)